MLLYLIKVQVCDATIASTELYCPAQKKPTITNHHLLPLEWQKAESKINIERNIYLFMNY